MSLCGECVCFDQMKVVVYIEGCGAEMEASSGELDEFVGLKAGDGFVLGCVVRSCVLTRIWLIVLAVVGMC